MQLEYGLKLETTQKLIMTPQLRQAIAILQLTAIELTSLVEKEILDNPVLEIETASTSDAEESVEDSSGQEQLRAEYENPPENDGWLEYLLSRSETAGSQAGIAEETFRREVVDDFGGSLHDHLEMQLQFAVIQDTYLTIGKYLIGCIDDNGYLCGTTAEAASQLGVTEQLVEDVLAVIQTFDPVGVGARSLKECLLLQIKQQAGAGESAETRLAIAIISEYLDSVANCRLKHIADKLNCTVIQVQQAVDIIRSLAPKPGRAFGSGLPGYILPDVTVEKINGEYIIQINDSNVPQLSINPYYRQVVREADADARKYVEGRINSAMWLIKSIEQRRRTIFNVAQAIVDLQRDFFDRGPRFLRPLTMKKVSEQIGVHESTVSRATANKYMATPHGMFSLHSFFSSGVHSASGEDVSASRVKQEIKDLVAAENSKQPLSDQALTDLLNSRGIVVSRRTVAKYREELNIPASSKRKRH